MLYLNVNKKTIRGSLAKQLLKLGRLLPNFADHGPLNLGKLFTTEVSEDFRWPKDLKAEWIGLSHARMERVSSKRGLSPNAILQLHGGAFVSGYSDMYRRSAIRYHRISCGTDVVSLDYRLAPTHPFPAALDDAVEAYDRLLADGYAPERIIVVGDSAGGGLSLSLCMRLRDGGRPLPKAVVTMSAWTDLAAEGESYLRNFTLDPLLGAGTKPLDVDAYAAGRSLKDPLVSPAYGDFTGFPPLMMHVGGFEMLESDTLGVARKAAAAGVDVSVSIYRGMFHVFQLAFDLIPEAKKAWREIGDFIQGQFGCTYAFRSDPVE
ncbi:MAG: alpha/beta hydrolase [Candidatus Izemoplasmatales bacterium]